MNLNQPVYKNRIISVMICVMLVLSVFMGSYVQSEAIAPAVVIGCALVLSACGLCIATSSYYDSVMEAIWGSLSQENKDYIESNASTWSSSGKVEMPKDKYDEIQSEIAAMLEQNSYLTSLALNKIVDLNTAKGFNFLYVLSGSLLVSGSESFWGRIPAMYSIPDPGEGYVYFNDNIRFRQVYTNNNTRVSVYVDLLNDDGVLTNQYLVSAGFSPYDLCTVGATLATSGNISFYVQGYHYDTGVIVQAGMFNFTKLSVDEMAIYNDAVTQVVNPPITYNIYNPPVNGNNEVEIPWPAGLTWEDLIGKSGAEIWDLGGTTPGETGKDYTGLFGTVIGWLQSLWDKIADIGADIVAAISSAVSTLSDPFKGKSGGPGFISGLWAFFAVLLALLIAIMSLIAKVIIFIGQLYTIPASSAMIHPTMVQGIEWARGFDSQTGVNLYGLVTGVISIVLGVVCFKLLRKIITGIGTVS